MLVERVVERLRVEAHWREVSDLHIVDVEIEFTDVLTLKGQSSGIPGVESLREENEIVNAI